MAGRFGLPRGAGVGAGYRDSGVGSRAKCVRRRDKSTFIAERKVKALYHQQAMTNNRISMLHGGRRAVRQNADLINVLCSPIALFSFVSIQFPNVDKCNAVDDGEDPEDAASFAAIDAHKGVS